MTEAGFDHERFAVYVWRSVRAHVDTKTRKSRRTLELPDEAGHGARHASMARELVAATDHFATHP